MLLVLLLSTLSAFSASQLRHEDSPLAVRYRALIEAYRSGDVDRTVAGVLALDHAAVLAVANEYVKVAARRVPADPVLDEQFFRAAALLHTDAAFRCWGSWGDKECWSHLSVARRLVDVSDRGARAGSFRRRWYAATALILTSHVVPQDALEYFKDAVEKFPDDVPLLTAAGWFSERLAHSAASRSMSFGTAQAFRRRHLQSAARFLIAALGVDPQAAEASLRLARVEVSMGHSEPAEKRLAALVARDDVQSSFAYLARLMLGDIRERDGAADAAARLYRDAIDVIPTAQSARVALAHLLYAPGDSSGAAAVIEAFVTPKAKLDSNDPWAEYRVGYPVAGQVLLGELRQEVRR